MRHLVLYLAAFLLTGTPTVAGSYLVAYIATDDDGDAAVENFTFTVTDAVTVDITTAASAIAGGAAVQLQADTDGTNLTHRWSVSPDEGMFTDDSVEDAIWTAPTPDETTSYTLMLRSEDEQNRFSSDSVVIMVRGSSSEAPIVSLTSRNSNQVFGDTWIQVPATVTNPAGNTISYLWTQTGGVTIFNATVASTYFRMPSSTSVNQNVSITLTVTDTVSLEDGAATLSLRVVPIITPTDSLFNRSFSNLDVTPGLAWGEYSQPIVLTNGGVNLIQSDLFEARGNLAIGDDYVQSQPAYVTYLSMNQNGSMQFSLPT